MTKHVLEAVAPSELIGQIRLPRHEVIPKLCCALKSYHNLCIHLQIEGIRPMTDDSSQQLPACIAYADVAHMQCQHASASR